MTAQMTYETLAEKRYQSALAQIAELENAATRTLFAMHELAACVANNATLKSRFARELGACYQADAELRAALERNRNNGTL